MDLKQIERFLLKGDMQDVIKYDIKPILHLKIEPGGYFGVPRQLFCLIDFLGAMYTGKYDRGNSSKGAEKFIKNIMGDKTIDENYKKNGKLMYDMYRHGLVHFFQPKKFILNGWNKTGWCVHKKSRKDDLEVKDDKGGKYVIKNARHLEIVKHPDSTKDFNVLVISLKCLFEDFQKSLNRYYQVVRDDENKYVSRWNKVAAYMSDYEEYPIIRKSFLSKLVNRFMKISYFLPTKKGKVGI